MNLSGAQCLLLCATQCRICKAKIALYENVRDNLRCLDKLMIKIVKMDGIWSAVACLREVSCKYYFSSFSGLLKFSSSLNNFAVYEVIWAGKKIHDYLLKLALLNRT